MGTTLGEGREVGHGEGEGTVKEVVGNLQSDCTGGMADGETSSGVLTLGRVVMAQETLWTGHGHVGLLWEVKSYCCKE